MRKFSALKNLFSYHKWKALYAAKNIFQSAK
jgi:hypothetical protein